MMADIEKREIHLKELQNEEQAYYDMHQKSIDNFEKELCHRRLYTDAYFRTFKKIDQMRQKEAEDMSMSKQFEGTASRKRIDTFIKKVNDEIMEKKQTLEEQKRIKDLKEEIEIQKIKNKRYKSPL